MPGRPVPNSAAVTSAAWHRLHPICPYPLTDFGARRAGAGCVVERDRQGRPLPAVSAGRQVVRSESVPAAQVGAAAGTAIVGAAKVGRLLTRSRWGLARRRAGGPAVPRAVQRLQDVGLT